MNSKPHLKPLIILIITLSLVNPATASELYDDLYDVFIDGASLRLGIGTRPAGLKVIRKSDDA